MIEEFLGIIVLFVSIHNALHAAVLLLQFFLVCMSVVVTLTLFFVIVCSSCLLISLMCLHF